VKAANVGVKPMPDNTRGQSKVFGDTRGSAKQCLEFEKEPEGNWWGKPEEAPKSSGIILAVQVPGACCR
jgi:hypothetical protein